MAPLVMRSDASVLGSGAYFAAGFYMQEHVYDNVPASATGYVVPQFYRLAGFDFNTNLYVSPLHFPISQELVANAAAVKIQTRPSYTAPVLLMDRLIVAQPHNDRSVTGAEGWNFFGSGVAGVPMYINGELITNRTNEGFFSVFKPLERGQNRFTFTQEGQEPITRIITNNAPAAPVPTPTIGPRQMRYPFPQSDEWAQSGATLTLRVTAPAGAVVYAQIGDTTIRLAQTNPALISTETYVFAAEFTGRYTLPEGTTGAVTDIGRPVYTMTFRDYTTGVTAPGHIHQIGAYAPFYARITASATWAFPGPTAVGGSHWMLLEGQRDRVSAITGNWLRLASGQWVSLANAATWTGDAPAAGGILSQGHYIQGEREDVIVWDTAVFPAMWAEFNGNTLIIGIGMQNYAPPIVYNPDYAMFRSISIGMRNGAPAYFMTLNEEAQLEGFYFEFVDNQLRLVLRKRPALYPGDYPLHGFTIVIDPGHGGSDTGALGPMHPQMNEKHLNWINSVLLAEILEDLGAQVIFTRDAEAGPLLSQRVAISRNALPDMFISMHANSTAETTDAGNIHGFTMWYRNANSRPLAQHFFDALYDINPLTNRSRSVNQANFYVVRPSWAPSVLFEVSFMNNIQDFAWMINPQNQADLAQGIADAVLEYFR